MDKRFKLKIRALKLAVATPKGNFGVFLPFGDGLTILRAENTSGKSTCLQAIIYALGLELMLSANREVPLPHVMTSEIHADNERLPVLKSEVFLEVENGRGEILTVHRAVKGAQDTRLVSTWNGPMLTEPGDRFEKRDFFVLDAGAAVREAGFHRMLAAFIGWDLPVVSKFNGTESLLYIEAIFPLFMVEQKHGWSALQARLPTFLGIQEMGKRAIEFVLDLDAHKIIIERDRISRAESELKQRWASNAERCQEIAKNVSGLVQELPAAPVSAWPPQILPEIRVPVGKTWVSLREDLQASQRRLRELENEEIPLVNETVAKTESSLASNRAKLAEAEMFVQELFSEVSEEEEHLRAIESRLHALREDLVRNNDAAKLKQYGSDLHLSIASDKCPTCQQKIADSLLEQEVSSPVMSLSDNIEFIKAQIESFETTHENSSKVLQAKRASLEAADKKLNGLRAKIRDLRQTLISDGRAPSVAAVRERLRLEERISALKAIESEFREHLVIFEEMAASWKQLEGRRAALPKGALSNEDDDKLNLLETLFVSQAKLYGFKSFPVESLTISRETYRPTREGFDLGFEISASDNIRVIWAFLTALLELSRSVSTNHLGLIIFDEPRQQSAKDLSFAQLLNRAVASNKFSQQVIFATSEPLSQLENALHGREYNIFNFDDFILTREKDKK